MIHIEPKSMKGLIKLAENQGWRVEPTKKGWMFYPDDKSKDLVLVHKTESDRRAIKNTTARLKNRAWSSANYDQTLSGGGAPLARRFTNHFAPIDKKTQDRKPEPCTQKKQKGDENMTAGTWYADVDFITNTPITPDEAMEIAEALAPHGAAVSISPDGEAGGASIAINANSALDASREATNIVTDAFGGKLEIVKLDVRNETTMDKEIATPVIPDLVGYAEIADLAGVSRQRARQFANLDGFPEPVVVTAAGPLRLKSSIEAWVERRNTKPGRPRVNA